MKTRWHIKESVATDGFTIFDPQGFARLDLGDKEEAYAVVDLLNNLKTTIEFNPIQGLPTAGRRTPDGIVPMKDNRRKR